MSGVNEEEKTSCVAPAKERRTLGGMCSQEEAERTKTALEKARELASSPMPTDPSLPKWWEEWDKPE